MQHQQNRSEKHQACYIKETEDVGGRKISAREELEAAIVKVKKKKKERKKNRRRERGGHHLEYRCSELFCFSIRKLLGSGFINVLCNLSMKK